jgi:hypothetical protein
MREVPAYNKARIYKIQRPLGGDRTNCLVYPKSRRPTLFVPYGHAMNELFEDHGNPQKLYVRAQVIYGPQDAINLTIERIAEDQDPDW